MSCSVRLVYFMFHSTELEVSGNQALMAVGLSLTNIVGWNLLVSSSPTRYSLYHVGVGALLLFLGMAIGPAYLAFIYKQINQLLMVSMACFPQRNHLI